MSTTNQDAYDLASANLNGVIHESVMNQIFDVSRIPLPFTDMIGTTTHSNPYHSWRTDKLSAADTTNAVIDGADAGADESVTGRRIGNHSTISTKQVFVSHRANAVDTIGYANELAYQVTRRQQELRRDVEAQLLANQASVEATSSVAGRSAGLPAWLTTVGIDGTATTENVDAQNGATGDGGWDDTAGNGLVAARTPGTTRALTETMLRDTVQSVYEQGGEVSVAMTTPAVKRKISEYLFSSSARIATPVADGGGEASMREASGAVSVFLTDFGTLQLVANRLQPAYDTDNDAVYLIDPNMLEVSYLEGYRVDPLAKNGLSDRRIMSVDWSLVCRNWDGLGAVFDIDPTAAMTF